MIFYVLEKFRLASDRESSLGPLKNFDPSTRKVISAESWLDLFMMLVKLRLERPSDINQVSLWMITPSWFQGEPTKADLLGFAQKIHSGEFRVRDPKAFVTQFIMALGDVGNDGDPILVLDPTREHDKKALRELGIS